MSPLDGSRMVAAADGARVRASCPRCGGVLGAEAVRVVAASDRDRRDALLEGRLNLVQCPACETAVRVVAPILFHDPESARALVYLPDGLTTSHEEQQRTIGELANLAMRALPEGAPRGHLLHPTLYLTQESFHEAVLVASGVPLAEIEAAREMTRLIERLLDLAPGEDIAAALRASASGEDPRLIRLSLDLADRADAHGDRARAERLRALAGELGTHIAPQTIELDDLIAALSAARAEGQLEALVLQIRPALDYTFFAALTDRHSGAAGAPDGSAPDHDPRDLLDLRGAVLTAIDAVDAFERQWAQSAHAWIDRLVAAAPPTRAGLVRLMALAGVLDPMFFSVLRNLRSGSAGGAGAGAGGGGGGGGGESGGTAGDADRSAVLESIDTLARQAAESVGQHGAAAADTPAAATIGSAATS